MSRLYLDANSIIYLVEAGNPFHATVAAKLLSYRTAPESRVVTSRLSHLECRIQPLRNADSRLLAKYAAFFSMERLIICEITANIIEQATDLRVRYHFKTPDAIHLATAIEEKVDVFLTGDRALTRCAEVNVEILAI